MAFLGCLCVLNPSREGLQFETFIFWAEQPLAVPKRWITVTPNGNHGQLLTILAFGWLIHGISALKHQGLTCLCGLKKPFAVLITRDFPLPPAFPFCPIHHTRTKSAFYNTNSIVLFPSQKPSETPHWFQKNPNLLAEQSKSFTTGTQSSYLAPSFSVPPLSCTSYPFSKYIFKYSTRSG